MTTTIEITDEQKATLDDLKDHDREAYKSVLARLIDAYSNSDTDSIEGYNHDNGQRIANQIDYAELATRTADELEGRLRR